MSVKTFCVTFNKNKLYLHLSVLKAWTTSDLHLLTELLSWKTTFLDIPFCWLSPTQSGPDRSDSLATSTCNSFWFHCSLCIVIIYNNGCTSFLAPHKNLRIYFFQNHQTADWLQMRNSDAGCRYRFPDKLIYLSLGTDKLRCKKTLCEAWYVIFKALRYDKWTAELCHLAVQHIHPSARVPRWRQFHFVNGPCDSHSQSCLSLRTNCPVYFLLLLWHWYKSHSPFLCT